VSVTVNPTPTATAGSNSPVCEGDDIDLTESGGDATAWNWDGPDSFSSTAQNPTISSATTDADGTYTVTITDGNGCTNTDNVSVTVNPTPTATAGSNSPVCEGDDINLSESGGDATSWNWDGPDNFSSNSQDTTISSATTAADGTYTVTVTDGNGCSSTDNVSVTVNVTPSTPTAGTHVSGEEQIEWNWNSVADADGYAYNTVDDYSGATDNGTSTSYTQTGLDCETSYTLYVWAYNACGESSSVSMSETTDDCPSPCGGISTINDIDGNTYNTVEIGSQCWMQENMATTHYANGTSIPCVDNSTAWGNLTTLDKAYCWYDDNINNKDTYGALYTWAAATNNTSSSVNPSGVQGICPYGWHIPSDDELKQLEGEVDATYNYGDAEWDDTGWRGDDAGSALAGNASLWNDGYLDSHASFGSSGFTALPGGYRRYDGSFYFIGDSGYCWSATGYFTYNARYRDVNYSVSNVGRKDINKEVGFSVRCVKDN
ncbi:MAG: FISUMP domain-containing protein, partial [Bacteroidales bacterium]